MTSGLVAIDLLSNPAPLAMSISETCSPRSLGLTTAQNFEMLARCIHRRSRDDPGRPGDYLSMQIVNNYSQLR